VRHAFFWSPSTGRAVDLGTLGGTATQVAGINDAGQVIGASFLAGNFIEHAFLWTSAGGMADLGTLGTQQSMATLINGAGQVVGLSVTPIPSVVRAFSWTPATGMIAIGALAGGISEPVQLTESGQVVGHSWADSLGTLHGFSWTAAGGLVDLGILPDGRSSQALAVNGSGVIMGVSTTGAGNLHAVVWPPTRAIVDLGTLGGPLSSPLSINDAGEVVGSSDTASGDQHAFVWSEIAGMLDLNDVTPDKPAGAVLTRATEAHDSGAILTESTAGLVLLRPRPNGFVTGGGWIDSPAGAVTADPGVAGRASFSVAARVPDGDTVPQGELKFELSTAGVSFSSDAYAWLRIAGGEARLAGTGSLNGTTGYRFMLRVVDGAMTGQGKRDDRLRLTISHATPSGDVVDYDNGLGTIGGGNIVIHLS
jgi:probable HAF family extracellular repeat protein